MESIQKIISSERGVNQTGIYHKGSDLQLKINKCLKCTIDYSWIKTINDSIKVEIK